MGRCGQPYCLASGAGGFGAEYVKPCPSCPPATSPLCILVKGLGCAPPHCLSRPERHQPWEGGADRPGSSEAQALAVSKPPLVDPTLCVRPVSGAGGEQGKGLIPLQDPGMEGTSAVTPCLSQSAPLSSKIECCPTKAEVFWGRHPGHCTLGPDAAERETAVPSAHTRTHTCPLRCVLCKGPSPFVT